MNLDNLMNNEIIYLILVLLISLYGGLIAPKLPNQIILFFDTFIGKILFLFLIGFIASKRSDISLLISLVFLITIHQLNKVKMEEYSNYKLKEYFEKSGTPIEDILENDIQENIYDNSCNLRQSCNNNLNNPCPHHSTVHSERNYNYMSDSNKFYNTHNSCEFKKSKEYSFVPADNLDGNDTKYAPI
tara:strand:- start:465 stop:1025 length:561 start_codon:yes stop_codon:yes gene_type:complete